MSKLDDVLISYGRYIGQAMKPENYGEKAEYMGFTQAKEEIKTLLLNVIEECFEDNRGYIDDKIRNKIKRL